MDFPTVSNERYHVKQCIGMGGMAAVFICYDSTLEVYRALKVLRPEMVTRKAIRDRFTSEAIAMAKVNHPNMVHVYDHGMEGLTLFIVMELIPYGSLQDYIDKHGVLNKAQAVGVCLDVAKALQKAHELGIIHRDIKPDNILLSPQGAKLTDFGIARVNVEANQNQTRTQAVMGTFPYMPPEQRLSAKKTNHQSDIYALAGTLFVTLTKKDPTELYDKEERKLLLEGLDKDIQTIIEKGCQSDLNVRYSNIQDFIADLHLIVRTKEDGNLDLQSPSIDEQKVTDMNELLQIWSEYTGQDDQVTRKDSTAANNQTATFNFEEDFSDPALTQHILDEDIPESNQQIPVSDTIYETQKEHSLNNVIESTSKENHENKAKPLYMFGAILVVFFCVIILSNSGDSHFEILVQEEDIGDYKDVVISSSSNGFTISPKLTQTKKSLLETNYSNSERLIAPLLEKNPEDEDLLQMMNLIHILRSQKHLEEEELDSLSIDENRTSGITELLTLAKNSSSEDKNWKAKIQNTKKKYPDTPIISHIELMYIQHHSGTEKALEAVENMIAQYPQSTALLQEKGKLLYVNQKYELAKDIFNQVLKRDPYSIQARRFIADISAQKNDESERIKMLMISMGDDNIPFEQYSFLEGHSVGLRNIGNKKESMKIANFCIDTTSKNEHHLAGLSCSYQNLQTSFWLGNRDEWKEQITETMNRLEGSDIKTDYIYEIRFFTKFMEAQVLIQDQNWEQVEIIAEQLERVAKNTNIPFAEVWLNFLRADLWSAKKHELKLREMQKDFDIDAFSTPQPCLAYFVQHRIAKSLQDDARNSQILGTIIDNKCITEEGTKRVLRVISRMEYINLLKEDPKNEREIAQLIEEVDQYWPNPKTSIPIFEEYLMTKATYKEE